MFTATVCLRTDAQGLLPGELWQARVLYDSMQTPYPRERIQRFLFVANNSEISQLTISERVDMNTGETYLSYDIKAANLEPDTLTTYKVREYKDEYITLVSSDSLYWKDERFGIGYARVNIPFTTATRSMVLQFLNDQPVRTYYPDGEVDGYINTYQSDGFKRIDVVDSNRGWTSDYRIFNFEGFVFVKGITSVPVVALYVIENYISVVELPQLGEPQMAQIRKERL